MISDSLYYSCICMLSKANTTDWDDLETQERDPFQKGKELLPYSVSELNADVFKTLDSTYPPIWLQGEISNFRAPSSGHFYFYLKDKKASVRAVMFKSFSRSLKFQLKEGLEVLVLGKVTLYQTRGDYQISCQNIKLKGVGDLQLEFQRLKEKLQQEGLFDQKRKRPLPPFPKHIAILTSPSGAAVRDILNILERRFRALRITIIPSLVQGDQAPASLLEGIRKAALLKGTKALIVARGGGSIEDLWCFNDETLVRAIADFPYPVISAVGHETDFTLSDFAADLRAPTPSAAAELITQEAQTLIEKLNEKEERLKKNWQYNFDRWKEGLHSLNHRLSLFHPQNKIKEAMILCDEFAQKLEKTMMTRVQQWRGLLEKLEVSLSHLNPLEVLKRGFAIVKKGDTFIHQGHQLKKGDQVKISFSDQDVKAEVLTLHP